MRTIDCTDLAQLGGGATHLHVGFADKPCLVFDPPLTDGERVWFLEPDDFRVQGVLQRTEVQGRPYWDAEVDRTTLEFLS